MRNNLYTSERNNNDDDYNNTITAVEYVDNSKRFEYFYGTNCCLRTPLRIFQVVEIPQRRYEYNCTDFIVRWKKKKKKLQNIRYIIRENAK